MRIVKGIHGIAIDPRKYTESGSIKKDLGERGMTNLRGITGLEEIIDIIYNIITEYNYNIITEYNYNIITE